MSLRRVTVVILLSGLIGSLTATATPASAVSGPSVSYSLSSVGGSRDMSEVFVNDSTYSPSGAALVSWRMDWGDGSWDTATDPYDLYHGYANPTPDQKQKTYTTQLTVCDANGMCGGASYSWTVYSDWSVTQENGSGVSYVGTWTRQANSKFSGGYAKYAKAYDSKAYYIAYTSQTRWITTKGPDRGTVEIWYDGRKAATINLYSSTLRYRVIGWTSPYDENFGRHKLQVRVISKAKRVDIDAFQDSLF